MRRFFIACAAIAALTAVALAGPGLARAADCGCTDTGPYKDPAVAAVASGATSPLAKYTVTTSGGSGGTPINLTVTKNSNATTVLNTSVPAGATGSAWGWSPDADRFVVHYVLGTQHYVNLYDLASSPTPGRLVWSPSTPNGPSGLAFSPHGRYFLFASVTSSNHTELDVVNAVTGTQAHHNAFNFTGPPGTAAGTASWGFSPDQDDRTFVYGYVNGANSVAWNVVNLSTKITVHSQNILAISAFWQFSPCGDVVGLVEQSSASMLDANLYKTSNGSPAGSISGIGLAAATLKVTTASHILTVAGTDHVLGPNTAGASCGGGTGPTLSSLMLAPASVTGGTSSTGTVTLSGTAPAGGILVNLSSSNTGAATVPANVTVPSGSATKTFTATTPAVSSVKTSTISASYGGVTKSATLTVSPAAAPPRPVASVSLSPTSVVGGNTSTGTVTLTGLNGTTSVTLTSSNPAVAAVSSPMTIPNGSGSGTFTIGTFAVTSAANVTITATSAGASATATLTVTPAPVAAANAIVPDPGCKANTLPRNDDGSTPAVTLPFPIDFFGTTYTFLYVNNNGNVTFNRSMSTYTPFTLTASTPPIIAPFFGDVDTRPTGTDPVTYSFGAITFAGRPAFCVDWVNVGYYAFHTDKLNSFQLILVDRSDVDPGDFDIVMNYNQIRWETGDASGGSNGFGGTSAGAGYSAGTGNASQFYQFPGSLVHSALLDSSATGLSRTSRNSTVLGRHIFDVRNGTAPAGGRVSGEVKDGSGHPLPGAPVQVCRVSDHICVFVTLTNSAGDYTATGVAEDDYTVKAFPPAGSTLSPGSAGPVHVPTGGAATQDVVLMGPTGPPPGTTITPSSSGAGGVPTVFWGSALSLSTTGCAGGTASYSVDLGGTTAASGSMTEGPAGTYTATIPPFYPNHGNATVTITIHCPSGPDQTTVFNIYIDPSGFVRTPSGLPIADAVVTLYRSDSAAGPFTIVPNGSFVMSTSNRSNPDLTDAAGHFGWDVISGYYKVRAEKEDCHAADDPNQPYAESAVLHVPPAVIDVDLRLAGPGCPDDGTPPTTTASQAPEANAAGWNPTDVTVTLAATDNPGGTGVKEITVSASGAGSMPSTTFPGDTASIPVSAEGVTTVTYFATDNAGNAEAAKTLVIRIDRTPPTINCSVDSQSLWPPNHKLVPVQTTVTVSDDGSGAGGFTLAAISQSEGDPAADTVGWTIGTADTSGQLRAERSGDARNGRTYGLGYVASDTAGNTGSCQALVNVPHDQGH